MPVRIPSLEIGLQKQHFHKIIRINRESIRRFRMHWGNIKFVESSVPAGWEMFTPLSIPISIGKSH